MHGSLGRRPKAWHVVHERDSAPCTRARLDVPEREVANETNGDKMRWSLTFSTSSSLPASDVLSPGFIPGTFLPRVQMREAQVTPVRIRVHRMADY